MNINADKFNLSDLAIKNRSIIVFLMFAIAFWGIWGFRSLGQSEDPPFTFKIMVIKTLWPGATATEVADHLTDRIEQKVMETGQYLYVKSYSKPGESLVMVMSKEAMMTSEMPQLWYTIRKKIGDIRSQLPAGTQGPYFNDEFGDTFGIIYALAGDQVSDADLSQYANRIRTALRRVEDVARVELLGVQPEKIWVELDFSKMAQLGISPDLVFASIQQQNAIVPAGLFRTDTERVHVRLSGAYQSVEKIRATEIRLGSKTIPLVAIANVHRGQSEDPSYPMMRYQGKPVIGVALSMRRGGDILQLGEALEREVEQLRAHLPKGIFIHKITDQSDVVKRSIAEFLRTLLEAMLIVLAVCFLALGWRSGWVVSFSIPLVLAITFAFMKLLDIGLHKISLGSLIIALGLLVDDAIIAIEAMAVKLQQGFTRLESAKSAFQSSAMPMLTGTLVTAAGFLPIATAASTTGEYTRSIFQVVSIALLASWVVAVVLIPFLGFHLLAERSNSSRIRSNKIIFRNIPALGLIQRGYQRLHRIHAERREWTTFHARLSKVIEFCMRKNGWVIAMTVIAFVCSVALFKFVPKQFFPNSGRLELIVDIELVEGASRIASHSVTRRFEMELAKIKGADNHTCYIGAGAPRFYLPVDQKLQQINIAQCVIVTANVSRREEIRSQLQSLAKSYFPDVQMRITRLENGPPVGFPLQYRISGEHPDIVQQLAQQVAQIVRQNPKTLNVNLDWSESIKVVRVELNQIQMRELGLSGSQVAEFLNSALMGVVASGMRERNESIEIEVRANERSRLDLSKLDSFLIPLSNGKWVPLAQIGILKVDFEPGAIWRRNGLTTATVRADFIDGENAAATNAEIAKSLNGPSQQLPPGYFLEVGGTVEDSARGSKSVAKGVPVFIFVVLGLLMLQLKRMSRTLLVVATAPLGMIGVTAILLLTQTPFGFVAMLGTIAMAGMIMRNSVILVDQIEKEIAQGVEVRRAIVDATIRRFRPIVLTALAAILAMIPLTQSIFFGPMAITIMGGLFAATVLTVLVVPSLYIFMFEITPIADKKPDEPQIA